MCICLVIYFLYVYVHVDMTRSCYIYSSMYGSRSRFMCISLHGYSFSLYLYIQNLYLCF